MSFEPYHQTANATLYQGDALAILPTLAAGTVHALITDPPYSTGGLFRADRNQSPRTKYANSATQERRPQFLGDNRDQRSYLAWLTMLLVAGWDSLADASPVCLFTDWRQLPTTTDALQAAGYIWRGIAVWAKTNGRPMAGRFQQAAEFIVWGSKGPMPAAGHCHKGLWTMATPKQEKAIHLTVKPVALLRHIVAICPDGGTILDPLMGSGVTGRAALDTGRKFIGIELDPGTAAKARDRLAQELLPITGGYDNGPMPLEPMQTAGRPDLAGPANLPETLASNL